MKKKQHYDLHSNFQPEELYEKLAKCILIYDEYYYDCTKKFKKDLAQYCGKKHFKKLFKYLYERNSLFSKKCTLADYLKINEFVDKILSETNNCEIEFITNEEI